MTTDESRSSNRMDVTCAIGTLVSHRRANQVVITNQGSAGACQGLRAGMSHALLKLLVVSRV